MFVWDISKFRTQHVGWTAMLTSSGVQGLVQGLGQAPRGMWSVREACPLRLPSDVGICGFATTSVSQFIWNRTNNTRLHPSRLCRFLCAGQSDGATMASKANSEAGPWTPETKEKFEGRVFPLRGGRTPVLTFVAFTARTEANGSTHARKRPRGASGVCIAMGATGHYARITSSQWRTCEALSGQVYADG